jgi:hypothetical protein
MRKVNSIVAENFNELRFELYNNYQKLDEVANPKPTMPCHKTWELLNVDTGLPELEKFKTYLKTKVNLKGFDVFIYSPFSGTGFHSDGHFTNRCIYPIISDNGAINLEIDINHVHENQRKHYEDNLYAGYEMSRTTIYREKYIQDLDKWFFSKSENNKLYIVPENECWEIGQNIHAHLNISFNHRFIIIIDTDKPIED